MPHITTITNQEDYGKFVLEPLERGYGQTIGNGLRRVLLSSIQGAAIAAIRIDKVFHEFSEIPGVKEDATEFILNLKDVAIKYTGFDRFSEATLTINVKGPGKVTGADIVCPPDFTIVNPECYLATISDPHAVFAVELKVNWGLGYLLPDKQEAYKGIIGLITVGSQFTPVRKVNYTVEQTRVGTRTDFERLILDVWTNGTVRPNDAVSQASRILDGYFRMFFELGNAGFENIIVADDFEDEDLKDVPEISIDDLNFSQRTFNCLRRAGLNSLRTLAGASESDLTGIRGFGKKSLHEVRDKLAEHGLALRPPKPGYRSVELADDDDYGDE